MTYRREQGKCRSVAGGWPKWKLTPYANTNLAALKQQCNSDVQCQGVMWKQGYYGLVMGSAQWFQASLVLNQPSLLLNGQYFSSP